MVRYPLEEIPLESPVVPVGTETFKIRVVALKADSLLAPTPQQSAILNGIPNWRPHIGTMPPPNGPTEAASDRAFSDVL
jgi:hypothetical protein